MDRHWPCQLGPNGTQGGAQGPEVFRQRTRGRTLGPRLPPGKGTAAGASGTNFDGLERPRRPHQELIATPLGLNYLRCRW